MVGRVLILFFVVLSLVILPPQAFAEGLISATTVVEVSEAHGRGHDGNARFLRRSAAVPLKASRLAAKTAGRAVRGSWRLARAPFHHHHE